LLEIPRIDVLEDLESGLRGALGERRSRVARALRRHRTEGLDRVPDAGPLLVRTLVRRLRGDFEETIRDDLRRADLDAREAAFDRWSAAAATDARVADALRSIQTDAADPDTAFLARLALRGAGGPRVGARRLAPGSVFGGRVFGRADGRDPFRSIEDMRRRMDEVFGSDPFFGGPLGADPFLGGGSPLRPRIRDEDLQRRLEEMQRELDALLGQGPGGLPRAGRGLQRRVSGVSVRRGPNGVYVEVTVEGPDGFETNTYEAPSMDALLEAHPELRGRVR
ncbi:MAG: hypothetical protein AAFP86_10200, partial [Planctomycetota bacterium]